MGGKGERKGRKRAGRIGERRIKDIKRVLLIFVET